MFAFFSAKHLGQSQYYLLTDKDADGNALDGANAYRLRVPADVPVAEHLSEAAHLYLWVPNALLREGLEVLRCLGVSVQDKPRLAQGSRRRRL